MNLFRLMTRSKNRLVLNLIILIAFLLAGCSEDKVVTSIDLYFMEVTETRFELASEPRNFDGPEPDLPQVLSAWMEGPQSRHLSRVVPEEVKLLDCFIRDGVAYLDFSPEISRLSLGGELEAVLVQSIVLTAIQVQGTLGVQILVNGEVIESLAGHMLINRPITF